MRVGEKNKVVALHGISVRKEGGEKNCCRLVHSMCRTARITHFAAGKAASDGCLGESIGNM